MFLLLGLGIERQECSLGVGEQALAGLSLELMEEGPQGLGGAVDALFVLGIAQLSAKLFEHFVVHAT